MAPPWDGSGNVTRTNGTNSGESVWQDDRDDGVNIRADRHDTHDEDLANSLENTVALDGQNTTTTDNAIIRYSTGTDNKFVGVTIAANQVPLRVGTGNLSGFTVGTNTLVGRKSGDIEAIAIGTASGEVPLADDVLKADPEHATDSATDAFVSATNTTPPADGVVIIRDFQSSNTTTTPTLDGKTLTSKDGSALWVGAVSGVHTLQYDSGADTYLVLVPAFPPNPTVQAIFGSGTWNRPAGCRRVVIEVFGAGGGGGGSASTGASEIAVSAGGGGGGYAKKVLDVTSISSSTITIGSGGTGGSAGNNAGSAGGNSSWADGTNTITANGGSGGDGSAAVSSSSSSQGGNGGSSSNGDINLTGENGSSSLIRGGIEYVLGDGGGGPNTSDRKMSYSTTSGLNGNDIGGGGTGGRSPSSSSAQAGGDGADGRVLVWEYY